MTPLVDVVIDMHVSPDAVEMQQKGSETLVLVQISVAYTSYIYYF